MFTTYLNEKILFLGIARFFSSVSNIFPSHLNSSVLNTVQAILVLQHNTNLEKLIHSQLFFPAEISPNFVDTESYALDRCNEAECYFFRLLLI